MRFSRRPIIFVAVLLLAVIIVVAYRLISPTTSGSAYLRSGALGYVAIDARLDSGTWQQAQRLLNAGTLYPRAVSSIGQRIAGRGLDFTTDMKPWVGEQFGIGLPSTKPSSWFLWADVADEQKAREFIGSVVKAKETSNYQGISITSGKTGNDSVAWMIHDGLAVRAESVKALRRLIDINRAGNTFNTTPSYQHARDTFHEASIINIVINGKAVNKRLGRPSATQSTAWMLLSRAPLKSFESLTISVRPKESGMLAIGRIAFDPDKLPAKRTLPAAVRPTLLQSLPADSIAAYTASSPDELFAESVDSVISSGKDSARQLAQVESLVGFSVADVRDALGDQWALSSTGKTDATRGFGALVAVDDLEEADKIVDASGQLARILTGDAPVPKTISGKTFSGVTFQQKRLAYATRSRAGADTFLMGTEPFVASAMRRPTLGNSPRFRNAWRAASPPSKVQAALWVDITSSLPPLLGMRPKSAPFAATVGDLSGVGGIVGWGTAGESESTWNLFLHLT